MACCAWSMAFASSAWSTSKSDVPRALPPHTSTLTSATIALNKRVPSTSVFPQQVQWPQHSVLRGFALNTLALEASRAAFWARARRFRASGRMRPYFAALVLPLPCPAACMAPGGGGTAAGMLVYFPGSSSRLALCAPLQSP